MNELIHKMKEVHDLELDNALTAQPLQTVVLQDKLVEAQKTIPMTREYEAFLSPSLVLGKGKVFNKTIFLSMLNRLGGFYRFYGIDKDGFTTSRQMEMRNDSLRLFVTEGVACLSGLVFVFSLGSWLEGHVGGIIANLVSAFLCWLVIYLYFRKGGPLLQKLHRISEGNRLNFLFPMGDDISFGSFWYDQVRIKINLPECPPRLVEEMEEITRYARFISGRTFILAHRSAISVDTESATLVRAGDGDPIFCIDAGENVIVFDAVSWGNNDMEKEFLAQLDAMKIPTRSQSN